MAILVGTLAIVSLIAVQSWRQGSSEKQQQQRRAEEQQRQRRAEEQQQQWRAEEQQQQRRERQRREEIASEIDLFIRTRRRFNTSKPLEYACEIALIERDCHQEARAIINTFDGSLFAIAHGGASVRVQHLTPFQGESTHRVFGYFRCCCRNKWNSAASWKDKWQKCKSCEAAVYPHEQHSLEQRGDPEEEHLDGRRPHDMGRCQKCCEMGSLCMPHMYYAW